MLLIILRGRTCEIIVENKFPDKILFYQPYLLTHLIMLIHFFIAELDQ